MSTSAQSKPQTAPQNQSQVVPLKYGPERSPIVTGADTSVPIQQSRNPNMASSSTGLYRSNSGYGQTSISDSMLLTNNSTRQSIAANDQTGPSDVEASRSRWEFVHERPIPRTEALDLRASTTTGAKVKGRSKSMSMIGPIFATPAGVLMAAEGGRGPKDVLTASNPLMGPFFVLASDFIEPEMHASANKPWRMQLPDAPDLLPGAVLAAAPLIPLSPQSRSQYRQRQQMQQQQLQQSQIPMFDDAALASQQGVASPSQRVFSSEDNRAITPERRGVPSEQLTEQDLNRMRRRDFSPQGSYGRRFDQSRSRHAYDDDYTTGGRRRWEGDQFDQPKRYHEDYYLRSRDNSLYDKVRYSGDNRGQYSVQSSYRDVNREPEYERYGYRERSPERFADSRRALAPSTEHRRSYDQSPKISSRPYSQSFPETTRALSPTVKQRHQSPSSEGLTWRQKADLELQQRGY